MSEDTAGSSLSAEQILMGICTDWALIFFSLLTDATVNVMIYVRFDREGGAQQVAQPLSDARASGGGRSERRCTLAQITDEGMGTSGQPAFVQVKWRHKSTICMGRLRSVLSC